MKIYCYLFYKQLLKIALVISPQPMAVAPLPRLAGLQPQAVLRACHGLFGKSAPEL